MKEAILILVATLTLAGMPGRADAALCVTKSGKLLVKAQCSKKKDKPIITGNPDFGLRGAANGLAVVDANDAEVGINPTIGPAYYGTTSRVLRQVKDGTWIDIGADAAGLLEETIGPDSFIYADAGCTGQRYLQQYGSTIVPLSFSAFVDKTGTAHYARSDETTTTPQFRFVQQEPYYGTATTPEEARAACDSAGGALVGDPMPCPSGDGGAFTKAVRRGRREARQQAPAALTAQVRYCQPCCFAFSPVSPGRDPIKGAPEHTETLGPFTAPLRVVRRVDK